MKNTENCSFPEYNEKEYRKRAKAIFFPTKNNYYKKLATIMIFISCGIITIPLVIIFGIVAVTARPFYVMSALSNIAYKLYIEDCSSFSSNYGDGAQSTNTTTGSMNTVYYSTEEHNRTNKFSLKNKEKKAFALHKISVIIQNLMIVSTVITLIILSVTFT